MAFLDLGDYILRTTSVTDAIPDAKQAARALRRWEGEGGASEGGDGSPLLTADQEANAVRVHRANQGLSFEGIAAAVGVSMDALTRTCRLHPGLAHALRFHEEQHVLHGSVIATEELVSHRAEPDLPADPVKRADQPGLAPPKGVAADERLCPEA